MLTRLLLAATTFAFAATPAALAEHNTPAERAAIEARIMDYFQGQGTADRTRLERAFAE